MRLAIIADPHVHDPSFDPRGDGSGAFRTLADTLASTRVFNESLAAFRQALEQIAAAGIKLVVIVGDLTDDGELYARRTLLSVTDHYAAQHGIRFFATFGNHDLFALIRFKRLSVEGDMHPFMSNLFYFKGVLASLRGAMS